MYEEDDPEAEAMSGLAVKGDMDFSQLGDPTKLLGMVQSTYDRQLEALNRSETNAKARFDAAEARIRERNRGPSQSEQLFMLSKALLAPRKYTGFGGTMGKISGAFGDISKADEKAREQRDAQLAALQDAYAAQGDAYGVTRAKTAADTLKTVAPLFKAKPRRTAISPLTGEVMDLDTAEIVQRPTPKIGAVKTGRDGKRYAFTNAAGDGDEYNKANWQELR